MEEFRKLWKMLAPSFHKDRNVLSSPFALAVAEFAEKLTSGDLIDKAFLENTAGTLIMNDRTICYSFVKSGYAAPARKLNP